MVSQVLLGGAGRLFPVPPPGIPLFDDITSTGTSGRANCLLSVFVVVVRLRGRKNLWLNVRVLLKISLDVDFVSIICMKTFL